MINLRITRSYRYFPLDKWSLVASWTILIVNVLAATVVALVGDHWLKEPLVAGPILVASLPLLVVYLILFFEMAMNLRWHLLFLLLCLFVPFLFFGVLAALPIGYLVFLTVLFFSERNDSAEVGSVNVDSKSI